MDAFGNERIKAEDMVGWTVVFHPEEADYCMPERWSVTNVLYCISVVPPEALLKEWSPASECPHDPNAGEVKYVQLCPPGSRFENKYGTPNGINYWARQERCSRLRKGDYAP